MRGTASTDMGGQWCGRAVNGVSNLSCEDFRQIEAHRAKDRPTPWAHLAARYGVNEIDLRGLIRPKTETPPPPPPPLSAPDMLSALWMAGVSLTQISNVLKIDERSVARMRVNLGLPPRTRGDGIAARRASGAA